MNNIQQVNPLNSDNSISQQLTGDVNSSLRAQLAEIEKKNSLIDYLSPQMQEVGTDQRLETALKFGSYLSQLPKDIALEEFLKGWEQYSDSPHSADSLFLVLKNEYARLLNISMDSEDNEWNLISGSPFAKDLNAPSNLNNPLTTTFSHFLLTFTPNQKNLSDLDNVQDFLTQFQSFLQSSPPTYILDRSYPSSVPIEDRHSYESIFRQHNEEFSMENFSQKLNTFYQQQIDSKGYFVPSQSGEDWNAFLTSQSELTSLSKEKESIQAYTPYRNTVTSKLNSEYNFGELMAFLITVVTTLQKAAVASSQASLKDTEQATAITEAQSHIPYLTSGMVGPSKKQDKEEWATMRSNYNQYTAAIKNAALEAEKGKKQDDASQQQTITELLTKMDTDIQGLITSLTDMQARIGNKLTQ